MENNQTEQKLTQQKVSKVDLDQLAHTNHVLITSKARDVTLRDMSDVVKFYAEYILGCDGNSILSSLHI